jgi:hypothetical protein
MYKQKTVKTESGTSRWHAFPPRKKPKMVPELDTKPGYGLWCECCARVVGILSFLSHPKVTLSLHPNLTFKTLFHPQLSVVENWAELGTIQWNWASLPNIFVRICFNKIPFNEEYEQREGTNKVIVAEQLWGIRTNLWCEKNSLVVLFSCVLFSYVGYYGNTWENCTTHMSFLHALVAIECGELWGQQGNTEVRFPYPMSHSFSSSS